MTFWRHKAEDKLRSLCYTDVYSVSPRRQLLPHIYGLLQPHFSEDAHLSHVPDFHKESNFSRHWWCPAHIHLLFPLSWAPTNFGLLGFAFPWWMAFSKSSRSYQTPLQKTVKRCLGIMMWEQGSTGDAQNLVCRYLGSLASRAGQLWCVSYTFSMISQGN